MTELLIFLATRLQFLFEPGDFRIVDSRAASSQGGDAMLVLESDLLRIRLTRDRGQMLMGFQPLTGRRDWFSPGLLRGLLTGSRADSEVLNDAWAKELRETLPVLIARLADSEQAEKTVKELKRQAALRAKELFG